MALGGLVDCANRRCRERPRRLDELRCRDVVAGVIAVSRSVSYGDQEDLFTVTVTEGDSQSGNHAKPLANAVYERVAHSDTEPVAVSDAFRHTDADSDRLSTAVCL